MLPLEQIQDAMARVLRGGDDPALIGAIADDGIPAASRLRIYRNHMLITLTDALGANFPVVRRLVDDRFFAYAAHEYIAAELPAAPSLSAYGAGFADFLASFPPCRDLPYLPDIARLERALGDARDAIVAEALPISFLGTFDGRAASDIVISFAPSWRLLKSDWPVDRIWLAHQDDAPPDMLTGIGPEGTFLEILCDDTGPAFRRTSEAEFSFREALSHGKRLEEATDAALALDMLFDLPVTLRRLFDDGLVVGCDLSPPSDRKEA